MSKKDKARKTLRSRTKSRKYKANILIKTFTHNGFRPQGNDIPDPCRENELDSFLAHVLLLRVNACLMKIEEQVRHIFSCA